MLNMRPAAVAADKTIPLANEMSSNLNAYTYNFYEVLAVPQSRRKRYGNK